MDNNENPVNQSWQALEMRVDLAESLWEQLLQLNDMDLTAVYAMEERFLRITSKARVNVATVREQDTSVDYGERLFLAPQRQQQQQQAMLQQDTTDNDLFDETGGYEEQDEPSENQATSAAAPFQRSGPDSAAQPQPNLQDLQKAQQEQIEEAISTMAAQLKAETARIHTTLQGQVTELDAMEDLASENVTAVTQVAADVKQHVAAGWTRTIGTWTLLFTVAGTFLFCLVTIQMIPKRAGACLFNCPPADQFCRILPNGRKECIDMAQMERKQQETDEATVGSTDDPMDRYGSEQATDTEVTCQVGMDGQCLELKEVTKDIPTESKQAPRILESSSAPKLESEKLTMDSSFKTTSTEPKKPMAEETARKVPQEPVKPKPAQATGGGGLGGIFSEEYVAAQGAETVPLYKGKPFSPRDVRIAADEGDIETLTGYLEAKPEWINKHDKNKWTVLHFGVRTGSVELVQLLLDAGAQVDILAGDDRDPLEVAWDKFGDGHPVVDLLEDWTSPVYNKKWFSVKDVRDAVTKGDTELLAGYLAVKPEWADTQDKRHWTGLHVAARTGSKDLIQTLLDAGCDESLQTVDGETALDIALDTFGSDHIVVEILQESRERRETDTTIDAFQTAAVEGDIEELSSYSEAWPALINFQDENGWTVLHLAALSGSLESVQILLDSGCDPDLETAGDQTAFDLTIGRLEEEDPIVELLRSVTTEKAQVEDELDEEDEAEFSLDAFQDAAVDGDVERLYLYLEERPDWIYALDENDWTVLHLAAWSGSVESVQLLLDSGSAPDAVNSGGETALDLAIVRFGDEGPVPKLLLQLRKEDNTEMDSDEDADEDEATPEDEEETEEAEPFEDDSTDGHNHDKESSATSVPEYSGVPLSLDDCRYAAVAANTALLSACLQAQPDLTSLQDENKWTILHLAARSGSVECVRILLEAGADNDAETVDNDSALDIAMAVFGEDHPVVELLRDW